MFKLADLIRKALGLEAKDNETDVELGARITEAIEALKVSNVEGASTVELMNEEMNKALAGFTTQMETINSTLTLLQTQMAANKTASETAITELKTTFSTELAKLASGGDSEGNNDFEKTEGNEPKDKKGIKVAAWKEPVVTIKQIV